MWWALVRRDHVELGPAGLVAYGHYGRPVLVFPSEQGRAWDFENNGMVDAVADLIDSGRVKLYCVESGDRDTWSNRSEPIEERARRHGHYEQWIMDRAVPWIAGDCGGPTQIVTLGCSLGAYHAANLALRHADVFPLALCLSGNYDPTSWPAWGDHGDAVYFQNPMAYVANMHGEHLDWLRGQVKLVLVVGQGAWEEHPTAALPSTRAFAEVLSSKGLNHELDVWGYDIPHDWPSWRAQLRHHLPRFC
jgi:esterase/lipase superfamily enzyme